MKMLAVCIHQNRTQRLGLIATGQWVFSLAELPSLRHWLYSIFPCLSTIQFNFFLPPLVISVCLSLNTYTHTHTHTLADIFWGMVMHLGTHTLYVCAHMCTAICGTDKKNKAMLLLFSTPLISGWFQFSLAKLLTNINFTKEVQKLFAVSACSLSNPQP